MGRLAYEAIASAMNDAYGAPMSTFWGQSGSIPLCNVFAETYPDAEVIMMGVEEPAALIHAPNESVAPSEIESMALPRLSLSNAMRTRNSQ
jgi:cysteinylglycine-S-conjugate dipeptidase